MFAKDVAAFGAYAYMLGGALVLGILLLIVTIVTQKIFSSVLEIDIEGRTSACNSLSYISFRREYLAAPNLPETAFPPLL
jgi:hypothetical protein